jgi:two-component sensor histidine kinase
MISTLFRGPGSLSCAAGVRRALQQLCDGGAVSPPMADDLALVATELISNAVHAGSSMIEVLLTIRGSELELAVADDAPGTPAVRSAELLSTNGRGLRIVEAVAREWGHRPAHAGKTVWARFTQSD